MPAGVHRNPQYQIRTEKELIDKIDIISRKENRSRNMQISYILKNYVNQYELEHGTVGE